MFAHRLFPTCLVHSRWRFALQRLSDYVWWWRRRYCEAIIDNISLHDSCFQWDCHGFWCCFNKNHKSSSWLPSHTHHSWTPLFASSSCCVLCGRFFFKYPKTLSAASICCLFFSHTSSCSLSLSWRSARSGVWRVAAGDRYYCGFLLTYYWAILIVRWALIWTITDKRCCSILKWRNLTKLADVKIVGMIQWIVFAMPCQS